MFTETVIRTAQGPIAVRQSIGRGLPVVLLHGNSSSMEAFRRQFAAPLGRHHRLIALDLPGHGASADARDPATGYTLPGYAATVREVLDALGIERALLFGWSLGGHVALELAAGWPGALGVALCAAPPTTPDPAGIAAAFTPSPLLPLLMAETLDAAAVDQLALGFFGEDPPDFAARDLRRTDGRARTVLFESLFRGEAVDEKALVETRPLPVMVIQGEHEPFASAAHLESIAFAALHEGRPTVVPGAGHAPFWTAPDVVNAALLGFLRALPKAARRPGPAPAAAPQRPAVPARRRAHA